MSAAAKHSPATETTDEPTVIVGHIVKYDVTELQIAELRTQFTGLTFDEPKAYEIGRRALATLRELVGGRWLTDDGVTKTLSARTRAWQTLGFQRDERKSA